MFSLAFSYSRSWRYLSALVPRTSSDRSWNTPREWPARQRDIAPCLRSIWALKAAADMKSWENTTLIYTWNDTTNPKSFHFCKKKRDTVLMSLIDHAKWCCCVCWTGYLFSVAYMGMCPFRSLSPVATIVLLTNPIRLMLPSTDVNEELFRRYSKSDFLLSIFGNMLEPNTGLSLSPPTSFSATLEQISSLERGSEVKSSKKAFLKCSVWNSVNSLFNGAPTKFD